MKKMTLVTVIVALMSMGSMAFADDAAPASGAVTNTQPASAVTHKGKKKVRKSKKAAAKSTSSTAPAQAPAKTGQ